MISILAEYDNNFFTFGQMISDKWNGLIHDTQKEQKIYFDLENNSSCKQQRVLTLKDKKDNSSANEYKFSCELFSAGGDWQVPVRYFRCQLIKGYLTDKSNYRNSHFIYIPKKTEGNYHLVPSSKSDGSWHAPDNSYYKDEIDPKVNERDCWKSLIEHLKDMIVEYTSKRTLDDQDLMRDK